MSRSSEVGDLQDDAKFVVRANWPQVGMCYCANQICRYDLIKGAQIVKAFDLTILYSRSTVVDGNLGMLPALVVLARPTHVSFSCTAAHYRRLPFGSPPVNYLGMFIRSPK